MSNQVDVLRVEQFKANIILLAQQKGSRLQNSVRMDGDIIGKRVHFDFIGATDPVKRTSRHSDTPLVNTPHSRRSASMADYDWADLIDNADKLKMLADPTGPYAINAVNSFGRKKDDIIITALGGNAFNGEDGSTVTALPSVQKVPHGGVGLTVAKLRAAKLILDAADVDEDQMRYIVCGAKQIDDLLGDTNVTSSDFNTVKALVQGTVDSYMGFTFIRSQRLNLDSNSDRLIYGYTESAVGLGVPKDITVKIDQRIDKNYSTQVYACMGLGAVRLEDVQVTEIACNE